MTTMAHDRGGKDDRFRSLYRKYYLRMVRYFVRGFHCPQEDAEELTQEAFLRFYEAIDEYRGDAEWAFLETVARNVAYNRIRAAKTQKRNVHPVDLDDPDVRNHEPSAPPEADYAEREHDAMQRSRLYDAIAQLPAGQRLCLQLWLEELQYDEIANTLRTTIDAVKSRLRDAKKLLRARLGDDATLPEDER